MLQGILMLGHQGVSGGIRSIQSIVGNRGQQKLKSSRAQEVEEVGGNHDIGVKASDYKTIKGNRAVSRHRGIRASGHESVSPRK